VYGIRERAGAWDLYRNGVFRYMQARTIVTTRFLGQIFCLLLLTIGAGGCGTNPRNERGARHSSSRIVALGGSGAEINLNLLSPSETASVHFQLANRGTDEVLIESVKTSCGCLKIDHYPERLAPNEQKEIGLSLDSRRSPGRFSQKLLVVGTTPSGRKSETPVTLKGFVQGVLLERPHVRLGLATPGQHVTVAGLLVARPGAAELHVTPSKLFDVQKTSIEPPGKGPLRAFYVQFVVKPTEEAQPIFERLRVSIVTSTGTYEDTVDVSGLLAGEIGVTPLALVFNLSSTSRQGASKTLTVAASDTLETVEDVELGFDRELLRIAIRKRVRQEICYDVSVNASVSEPYTGKRGQLLTVDNCHRLG